MTTKLITVFILVAALFVGWRLWLYYDEVQRNEESARRQEAATAVIPANLPGVPYGLESSLEAAQTGGGEVLGNWLKTYGPSLQDPRKAWIELDYVLLLSRENPAEARRLFAAVKQRTPESSPVYSRIKKLEKTYE